MMHPKLLERRVLVTRPGEPGKNLCAQIKAQGGQAWQFPLIHIEPLFADNRWLEQLASFDMIIFISQNAVKYGLERISRANQALDTKKQMLLAVGEQTANALKAQYQPVLFPSEQSSSEGLLALAPLQTVQDKKVLIVRGHGGRELLAQTLTSRGADVHYAEVYQRACLVDSLLSPAAIWQQNKINTLIFSNGESIAHFKRLLPESAQDWLQNCEIITPSQRLAEQAKALTNKSVHVSLQANNQAFIDAML